MTKNSFTFNAKTGDLTAVSFVRASRDHTCECGTQLSFTTDWPEGLTSQGSVDIKGVSCPSCHAPVVLPRARYWVENHQLLSAPLPAERPS
jgi:hypothetical protein